MSNISLFGGTGRTGKCFLTKALHRGHKIKMLIRKHDKSIPEHTSLELINGDVLNYNDVEKTIAGSDVVVDLLGHRKDSPSQLLTVSVKYIIDAMKKFNIKRLIVLTGAGVRDPKNDTPQVPDKVMMFVMRRLAGKKTRIVLEDSVKQAEYIKKSDLEWTIVRTPVLKNKPGRGSYKTGYVGKIKGSKLRREDLADFILDEIENGKFIQDMPFVVN